MRTLIAFAILLVVVSAQWDQFLQDFDLDCLKNMMEDQAAADALSNLQTALNPKVSDANLVSIQALQLSEHLQCVDTFSDTCGTYVHVFPPRSTVSSQVTAITNEISQMSDDQLLAALNYDVDGFCASLTQMQQALAPYDACILTNLNAIKKLPSTIANAVLEYLQQQAGPSGGAWNFNLSQVLDLSNGCDDFKSQVASSMRSQLSSAYWSDVISATLTLYDDQSFEASVSQSLDATYQCTIPTELACTQVRAKFYSVCQLAADQNYDFIQMQPIDGRTDVGSASYETYVKFAETTGVYPCSDTFSDACFGSFLTIPDVSLQTACKSASYYYSLTGETPATQAPTVAPSPSPTPSPSSDNNNNNPTNPPDQSQPTTDAGNDSGLTPPDSAGLSAGGIVAIVLSVLIIVVGGTVGGFLFYKKKLKAGTNYQVQLE